MKTEVEVLKMKDKYDFDVEEGDIVAVSAFDTNQNQFFDKARILEIKEFMGKYSAKVSVNGGEWVSSSEMILIQRC